MINVRKILHYLMKFLPHVNIVLAVTMITLFITDRYNRAMKFLYNDNTKWLLLIFCITVTVQALAQIYLSRCRIKERNAAIDKAQEHKPADRTDMGH